MRSLLALAFILLALVAKCSVAEVQPAHMYHHPKAPVKRQGVRTPMDFLKAWDNHQTPEYVSPCLAISISPTRDFVYAPGFDLLWFSGYRTIRQFLRWNKEFDGSNPAKPHANLTMYLAGSQGFFDGPNDKDMILHVWDQCAVEKATMVQRQVPGVAFFADYAMTRYGIEVPDEVLRQVVYWYWPGADNPLWSATNISSTCDVNAGDAAAVGHTVCDRGCLVDILDWSKVTDPAVCGCNPDLVKALKYFAAVDPSKSTIAKPYPTTKQCLQQLPVYNDNKGITMHSWRAAIVFCYNAFSLHTGNGLGWRPPHNNDGYEPGFFRLLSFPEYVQPNYPVEKLRWMGGLVQTPAV